MTLLHFHYPLDYHFHDSPPPGSHTIQLIFYTLDRQQNHLIAPTPPLSNARYSSPQTCSMSKNPLNRILLTSLAFLQRTVVT